MGNHNTSGIIEEEKATSKAPEKSQVSSPHDQEEQEEEQIVIEEDEKIDCQEKAAEKEKAKPESGNEDSETQTTTLPSVETKESNPADEISESQNEVHDQPSDEVDHVENDDVADDIVSETDDSFNPLNLVDISVARTECSAFDPLDEVMTNDEKALDTNPGEVVFVQTEVSNITAHDQDDDENDECIPQSQSSLEIEPILSCKGGQVELKKSPSFDFGLPFDARPGESDQTPLLYNGTAARSFSSSSTMRFQNTGVQTEHYEAVEVEEKTIRMERSNSENSSRANLSLNLQSKKENVDFITNAEQDICDSGEGQENGLVESSCDVISPKESGKRKSRSTFFTTCICCTAAIS